MPPDITIDGLGTIVITTQVTTKIWARRVATETTLFITLPGEAPKCISLTNEAANMLAAQLKGEFCGR